MITIETQISGGQIGGKLAQDPEEFAYALIELADELSSSDAREVAEYVNDYRREEVAVMLDTLAAALREGA